MPTQIHAHSWLRRLQVAHVTGPSTALAEEVVADLLKYLKLQHHGIQDSPSAETDVLLTTARLGEPLGWRESMLFTARRRFKLKHNPTVFTVIHASPGQFAEWLSRVERVLDGDAVDVSKFAGVPETAQRTLLQQGRRGGPIMFLLRVLQIQAKCIRVLLVVGEDMPESAFLFDLVGAHPQIQFDEPERFYQDLAVRIATAASTEEITRHEAVEPKIPSDVWNDLDTIREMVQASREFGKRDFFTEMIQVSQVAEIPGFSDAISSQYSEGCFATWDSRINGLLTTITGSARPVRKESITGEDLAVIVGIKPQRDGALIRKVEGHPNHPPSSEAVEMIGMDVGLPRITLQDGTSVPVIRSKLHGHRGIQSFESRRVEYVPLPEGYLHYPVSCSTDAQYRAVQSAFSGSVSLHDPADPRMVVFTILPGHGLVVVEKWSEGKQAFQLIWEAMDSGDLEISSHIPQGPFAFVPDGPRQYLPADTYPMNFEYPARHEA